MRRNRHDYRHTMHPCVLLRRKSMAKAGFKDAGESPLRSGFSPASLEALLITQKTPGGELP